MIITKENKIELISKIKEYYDLPAGWDNETDKPTCRECLDRCLQFTENYLVPEVHYLPEESMGTGEEVALYWDYDNFYMVLYFYPDYCTYYVSSKREDKKEKLSYKEIDLDWLAHNIIPKE